MGILMVRHRRNLNENYHRRNPRVMERGTKRNQPWVPTMENYILYFFFRGCHLAIKGNGYSATPVIH